jgi:superfamily II DNA or RNA helicase
MIKLKDHQKFVVDYIKTTNQKGIILNHGLGSGKTITAIFIAELYDNKKICIVPASMRTQWVKEINLVNANISNYDIMSYERFYKNILKDPYLLNDKTVIIDEAHRARNSSSQTSYYLEKHAGDAFKIILLTGTIMVNTPQDISQLLNLVVKRNYMPTDEQQFDYEFRDLSSFRDRVSCYFSYYMPDNMDDYPSIEKHSVGVKMSKNQVDTFKKLSSKLSEKELDMMRHGNFLIRNKMFNAFLNKTRQISNILKNEETSPKLNYILKFVNDNPKPAIIYSNWLDHGIYPMAKLLKNNNLKFLQFTGEASDLQKKKIVETYNSGKLDVLLLSSSGGEGLDLKNTRQIHIMEPHWNIAKINQVIGRGRRYRSHISLPKEDRHVDIYFWASIIPGDVGVDQYLYRVAKRKQNILKVYQEEVINSSIEKNKTCNDKYTKS